MAPKNRPAQSTREEGCANTLCAAQTLGYTPSRVPLQIPLHKGPHLPSANTKHAQLHIHQAEQLLLPIMPAQVLCVPRSPPRDTHSFSTAERFPSITLTKSWYEMVSLTPPVTSEIIFFSSRWVFGAPIFSIILLTDIKSARARQAVLP